MTGPRLSIIPARAATDRSLKPRDLQVLCVLGRHTDDLGWCRRSQVKMADEMGCARATVYEAIERLVKSGYLERHVQAEASGRDSAHVYRVILDPKHPDPGMVVAPNEDPADKAAGGGDPAGIPAPPAGPEPAPPAGPGPAPINDTSQTIPVEREREARAGEREDPEPEAAEHGSEATEPQDDPRRAAFEKRVMRFCTGKGFVAGPWPNWDTSSPGWIGQQFAALTPAERAEAERWRDAYLIDIAARKQAPVVVGNFLRGRVWTGLDEKILERAEKLRQGQLKPEERARPDGWAPWLGPAGMAWLVAALLRGPADAALAERPFLTDAQLRQAWPDIWNWQALQRQQGGSVFGPRWHGLKPAMEFVPHGTAVMEAWRAAFAARGWRWLAVMDAGNGLWLPADGPDGLGEFERAVVAATDEAKE